MENLVQEISDVCNQIIKKHSIKKVATWDEFHNAVTKAENKEADQEIAIEENAKINYINLEKKISIELYKEQIKTVLCEPDGETTLEMLKKARIIIEEKNVGKYSIYMQPGDIEISLNINGVASDISKTLSTNPHNKKNGAMIVGEDCFIGESKAGERGEGDDTTILATQDDLKAILEGLQKLV